uniref:hypothetical protein n=1 Tax=Haliscomenobacter sp. TaxID=2717303 RepID=UPI00336513E3
YQIDADFVQDANILLKNYGALKEQGMDKNNLQGGRPDDEVKFFIDSENAYNHVMDQFGSVIDWDGDTMIAPRKYWGAIQELALAASGEASEEQGMAEGSSYNIDQDDHDEFTPDEIVRIKNSHFPDTLRDNLRAAKKEARRAKHFPSSSDGGDSKLGSPVGSASDNTYEGVAEGSGLNVVKSIKVGNFRHDLVDTGMGWQVRIYNGDELYDTGLSKNSEQKGLAALEDAVAYTEKQTRTKRQGVAEAGYPEVDHMPGPTIKRTQTGCKRCHGKGYVYKTPDGEVHPMNQQGAKKYKCGKCDGIGFVKQDMAEGHGNYAGDRPVNLGGVSMKKIQIGDTVRYIDQTAQVVDMSRDREHARITIPSSATTKTVLTSDLRQLGQGVSEETLSELSPATLARYKIKAGAAATAADSTGDRKTGDRRFSGIVKATKKQFDQDAKQSAQAVHESRLRLMASIIKTK